MALSQEQTRRRRKTFDGHADPGTDVDAGSHSHSERAHSDAGPHTESSDVPSETSESPSCSPS